MKLIRSQLSVSLTIFATLFCKLTVQAKDEKSVLCFHDIATIGGKDPTRLNFAKFDATLCTHVASNLIRVDSANKNVINQGDKNGKVKHYLKAKNPQLKNLVILNLDEYFGYQSHNETLDKFIHDEMAKNVVAYLEKNKYDGIYLELVSSLEKKRCFINIINSLKKAFQARFILAYVGNHNKNFINQEYDIPYLGQNVDLLILETYNFHDATMEPKLADHHAPLYNRPWDKENKTVDFLVNLWINKGFPANKILLTIPLWGNSWKLSSNETNPPAPANGKGAPGRLTSRRGILGYFEICENINKKNWQVFPSDNHTMGPYAVSPFDTSQNRIWVGYDDPAMAVLKSEYILSKGLGGAAVKDIFYDDIHNNCNEGNFPVLQGIRKTFFPNINPNVNETQNQSSTTSSDVSLFLSLLLSLVVVFYHRYYH